MYDALRDFIQNHRDKIDLTKLQENVKEFITLWMGDSIKPTPSNIDPDLSTLQGEPA